MIKQKTTYELYATEKCKEFGFPALKRGNKKKVFHYWNKAYRIGIIFKITHVWDGFKYIKLNDKQITY